MLKFGGGDFIADPCSEVFIAKMTKAEPDNGVSDSIQFIGAFCV